MDSILGIHEQALISRGRRAKVLAHNIANMDTPGYKARDIDFAAHLKRTEHTLKPNTLATTNKQHIKQSMTVGTDMELKYRIPLTSSLDGNTVDSQLEVAAFTENALRYQASLNFVTGRFKGILTALRGE